MLSGLAGGVALAVALLGPAVEAVRALNAARQQRADLVARLAVPPVPAGPLVASDLAVPGGSAAAARDLSSRLRRAAGSAGVLVEALAPGRAAPGLVTVRVRLSGPEKAVLALVDATERGTPLTRFRDWRIDALSDGGVRVEGEMVAAWR